MKTFVIFMNLVLFPLWVVHLQARHSQEYPTTGQSECRTASIYAGVNVSETNENFVSGSESTGNLPISKNVIQASEQETTGSAKENEYFHGNRYFVLSNGLGIPKGSGYYQNSWIFFNQVHYGLTNNFSIGAGIIPLFLFAGTPSPVWIVPSITFPVSKDKFSIGANLLVGAIAGVGTEAAGFLSFTATIGNRIRNLSLGLGYGYAGTDWSQSPLVSLSGMVRTGARHYFMTENYYVSGGDDFNLISFFGGRFDFRSLSLDYGLLIPMVVGMDDFFAIPWLGIAVPFGKH